MNLRPIVYETTALTAELTPRSLIIAKSVLKSKNEKRRAKNKNSPSKIQNITRFLNLKQHRGFCGGHNCSRLGLGQYCGDAEKLCIAARARYEAAR